MGESEIRFHAGVRIEGPHISFRLAEPNDAEFILSLRLDEEKGRYLSATDGSLERQRQWIEERAGSRAESYFVIETSEGKAVGTVRLYDIRGNSFSWGSWILSDEKPRSAAVESTLMVYVYGLSLGFERAHFEVVKGNERVWQYHERTGAVRVGEDQEKFYYEMPASAIVKLLHKYESRLDGGVTIVIPHGSSQTLTAHSFDDA